MQVNKPHKKLSNLSNLFHSWYIAFLHETDSRLRDNFHLRRGLFVNGHLGSLTQLSLSHGNILWLWVLDFLLPYQSKGDTNARFGYENSAVLACKQLLPRLRATWVLMFWPMWPAEAVCKLTLFGEIKTGKRYINSKVTLYYINILKTDSYQEKRAGLCHIWR